MKATGMTGMGVGGGSVNQAMLGAVRAAALAEGHERPYPCPRCTNFITISRQAGAGGRTLAQKLAERLNVLDPAAEGERPWSVWDHELVEKVAREHGLDAELVATLEEASHPWFVDLLSGLVSQDPSRPDEYAIYKRVAAAIRGLAKLGRAIIVGRGGAFITRGLPGGVHVRLIAPRQHRIHHVADQRGIPEEQAARMVEEIDHTRESFYRRYWPAASLDPERFTLVINTAGQSDRTLADVVAPLVKIPEPAMAGVGR